MVPQYTKSMGILGAVADDFAMVGHDEFQGFLAIVHESIPDSNGGGVTNVLRLKF